MITQFLQSWPMFQASYLTALLAGFVLSLLGVVVVARGQVFLAAAISQAAALGAALALLVQGLQPAVSSVGFGLLAALFAGGIRPDRRGREEAVAWVFLCAASLTVLLVAREAMGMKQVQALLASSLIGASGTDVAVFAALAGVVGAGAFLFRARLVLLLSDPTMASAVGVRVRGWLAGLAIALGLAAGLGIRSTGLLFTFGCLALPALIARNLCRRTDAMFVVAPGVGVAGVAVGLVLAHGYDYPPGQVVVTLLGAGLAAAWGGAALRRGLSGS